MCLWYTRVAMYGRSFQFARVIVVVLPLPSVVDVFPSVEPTSIVDACFQFARFEQNSHFEEIYQVLLRLIAAAVRLQKRELYRTYNQNGSHSLAIAPIVLTCSPEESHRLVSYTYMHVTDTSSLLGEFITQSTDGYHDVLHMESQNSMHVCIFH